MEINVLLGIIAPLVVIVTRIGSFIISLIKPEKRLSRNKGDGLYYDDGDTENPYCPKCYENKRRKVLLIKGARTCPKCKTVFERPPVVIVSVPNPGPKLRIDNLNRRLDSGL